MSERGVVGWQGLKKSLSREAFVERFKHPFLIRRAPTGQAGGDGGDFGEHLPFHTNVVDTPLAPGTERASSRLDGATILPITKKLGNPYPERISVGRALNCDVVVRDASVSKLHGHFRPVSSDEAEFVDRESANGTKVNGTPVKAGPSSIVSGDTIIFGAVALQFVGAKRLWDLL